ncbi:tetratricopeptide repeat protein [Betaproteobacteria bacterium PRO7]|nr:tetratricopeptide repeat protein [Burkholderiaceae bacterium]MDL1861328.1 tetratricopeptide repeat protein [Betaproteobacteria bacterium PRO7]
MRTLRARAFGPAVLAALLGAAASIASAMDIDALWEYADPAASEMRFRAALERAQGDDRLELLTQIARTFSLRRDFAGAHALLDEVEPQLAAAGARAQVRYLLERGRSINSAGERDKARALFLRAWERGRAEKLEGLAVDAAHMVAISYGGSLDAVEWNRRGLAIARTSRDAKARALIPAMLNNAAWDLHDLGRHAEALPLFQEALAEWTVRKRPEQIRFAKYAVGRCLRLLNRGDEALSIQRALELEYAAAAKPSGYVFEEIAELLEAGGKTDEARPYFRRAAELLGRDEWLVKKEAARLARLRAKGAD